LAEISCNKDKCGKGELAAAEHLLSTCSAPSQDIKLLYNYGFRSLSLQRYGTDLMLNDLEGVDDL